MNAQMIDQEHADRIEQYKLRIAALEAELKHEVNEKLTIADSNRSEINWLRNKIKSLENRLAEGAKK
jgi:BMFP domain-containing protein YqiC